MAQPAVVAPLGPAFDDAWLQREAEAGHATAALALALCYLRDSQLKGVAIAVTDLLKVAAARGDAEVAACLEVIGAHGRRRVVGNDLEAKKWAQVAARTGLPTAMYLLGALYDTETGGSISARDALLWFGRAKAAGLPRAHVMTARFALNGRGGAETRLEWVLADLAYAIEHRDAQGFYELAILHDAGINGPPDRQRAHDLYLQSAALGSPLAVAALANLRADRGDHLAAALLYDLAAAASIDGDGVAIEVARQQMLLHKLMPPLVRGGALVASLVIGGLADLLPTSLPLRTVILTGLEG